MESIRELEFFKSLFAYENTKDNEEAYFKLCKSMKYEFKEMGSFVFKEGDPSNGKFYVILSGEVGVIVQTQVANIFEKDKERIAQKRRSELNVPSINNLLEEDANNNDSWVAPSSNSLITIPSTILSLPEKGEPNKGSLTPSQSLVALSTTISKKGTRRRSSERSSKGQLRPSLVSIDELEDPLEEYREMVKSYGNLVRILGKGESFGETGRDKFMVLRADIIYIGSDNTTRKKSDSEYSV